VAGGLMGSRQLNRVLRGEVLTHRQRRLRILAALLPGVAWLALFSVVPLLLICGVSFLTRGGYGTVELPVTVESYRRLAGFGWLGFDALYPFILLRSLALGGATAVLCLAAGMPLAFFIAGLAGRWKTMALTLVVI